jgi:hypothetical protein
MSRGNHSDGSSHAAAWALSALAALVIYVLSIGPVAGLMEREAIPDGFASVLEKLYWPLSMVEGTPLEEPLLTYIEWWVVALKKP